VKVLIVGMSNSVHLARWVEQIADQGWDIHLFPSIDTGTVHPALRNVTVHWTMYARQSDADPTVRFRGLRIRSPFEGRTLYLAMRELFRRYWPSYRAVQLARVLRRLKPDVVHSIEFQYAGYLTLEARKRLIGNFPPWIITNLGSDIYLYGRLAEHRNRVRELLATCDYYTCECERDVKLAKQMGLRGEVLAVGPNAGGFHLDQMARYRQPGPTSARRLVVLKGYQHWAGRALFGLRAIALCAAELHDLRVTVYAAEPHVKLAAEVLSNETGIEIECVPHCSHEEILSLFGRARAYIGLSISDGISTSLLEAMVMGAFPIQSSTACANEWIVDGETGAIVPPEDPHLIAQALRRALTDDILVDQAAERNATICRERLHYMKLKSKAVEVYRKAVVRGDFSHGTREDL
jgi:glycosyltransferase involved in cell wall biosynthesis